MSMNEAELFLVNGNDGIRKISSKINHDTYVLEFFFIIMILLLLYMLITSTQLQILILLHLQVRLELIHLLIF